MGRTLGLLPIAVISTAFVATAAAAGSYRLPWAPGMAMELTQDCNDSFYADHVGSGKNAWDFANGTHFSVVAAREGVVTHVKVSSRTGCESAACVDLANYIVVDHGDGTSSIYLHLDGDSLADGVKCGQPVRQGQRLATAGSTGWSTGPHLHFQVNVTHTNETRSCECGEDGMACAENDAAWSTFWSTPKFPSLPVAFDEWEAAQCSDRRMVLPVSQNIDVPSDRRLVTVGRSAAGLHGTTPTEPLVAVGVGGRKWPGRFVSGKSRPRSPEIPQPSPPAPAPVRPRP